MRKRFPEIGPVEPVPPQPDKPNTSVLMVDQAPVLIESEDGALADEDLQAPMNTLRPAGMDTAVARHHARLRVSAGGSLDGLEGAEAYATLVHFVTAAAATFIPAAAVYWEDGYCLSRIEDFVSKANQLLEGKMPVINWISFATVIPRGYTADQATGMVTFGLQQFVGRELELAPRPAAARDALRILTAIARMMLDKGTRLSDGLRLEGEAEAEQVVVREKNHWLRQNMSAFVLVSDDAIVDASTLRPRAPAA